MEKRKYWRNSALPYSLKPIMNATALEFQMDRMRYNIFWVKSGKKSPTKNLIECLVNSNDQLFRLIPTHFQESHPFKPSWWELEARHWLLALQGQQHWIPMCRGIAQRSPWWRWSIRPVVERERSEAVLLRPPALAQNVWSGWAHLVSLLNTLIF